jgi:RNA polymerase sigma-70 factor (ECF subfamily)
METMTLTPESRTGESQPDSAVPSLDERELVRDAAAGDSTAFDQIVRLHHRRVYAYLQQMTRRHHDAEDLTQSTFIKAFHALKGFDPQRPLINWLLTIARNTALNHFRDTKKWEEMPYDMASSAPTPAHQAESRDHATNLWDRARAVLSVREYEVMWLRFAEEMSVEETSRVTGLTQAHVKVIVFRARQSLLKGEPKS